MLLGSGLTDAEQRAFAVLLNFFEGEEHAERKALALCVPFAIKASLALMAFGEMTEGDVAHLVMQCLADRAPDPQVQYLWGQRRDTVRSVDTLQWRPKLF